MASQTELLPHLFRTEFAKITAVLCKHFSMERLEVAEDIVGETFLAALETWSYKGLPPNPTAWLYTVARNKAINYIQRDQLFKRNVMQEVAASSSPVETFEIDLSEKNISDSQLQMLFAICHPEIPQEAQVGLALRILCGFGVEEIANAFLTNKEVINKRLFRAKEKLRTSHIAIVFPAEAEIPKRLQSVLTTLYLLFNEGYYSESQDEIVRQDLSMEAIRLTRLLIDNPQTDRPEVNALLSLMYFHASRFPARRSGSGEMILYRDQDVTRWDQEAVAKGAYHLNRASQGATLTRYHLEASIAYQHTVRDDNPQKWETILYLYNQLLMVEYSPIAALNRAYAVSRVKGNRQAIEEAEKLKLENNHYYFTLLGALYASEDQIKARHNLERALTLVKTRTDRATIQAMLDKL